MAAMVPELEFEPELFIFITLFVWVKLKKSIWALYLLINCYPNSYLSRLHISLKAPPELTSIKFLAEYNGLHITRYASLFSWKTQIQNFSPGRNANAGVPK